MPESFEVFDDPDPGLDRFASAFDVRFFFAAFDPGVELQSMVSASSSAVSSTSALAWVFRLRGEGVVPLGFFVMGVLRSVSTLASLWLIEGDSNPGRGEREGEGADGGDEIAAIF